MNLRFEGKLVAVSGAGHGFGRAIAESFAALGARVFGCAPEAAAVPDIAMATVDLTDRAAAAAWIAGIEQAAGAAPLDVLVNNAGGVAGQVHQPLETVSDEDWDRIIAINVGAAFTLSRAAAAGHEARRARPDRQHLLRRRIAGVADRHSGLRHRQARRSRADAPTRARTRPARHHREQRRARAGHQQSRQLGAMGELRTRQSKRRCWMASRCVAWARRRTSPTPCCSSRAHWRISSTARSSGGRRKIEIQRSRSNAVSLNVAMVAADTNPDAIR